MLALCFSVRLFAVILLFFNIYLLLFNIYLLKLLVALGFPCGSAGQESACSARDLGVIPGLGRSPGEGNGYLLQYSGLENSMDCVVHEVATSQTQLSDFHTFGCFGSWLQHL